MQRVNPCHAEYFQVLQSSPFFILLTYSILVVSMYLQAEWKNVDPDQMASLEAIWSGSTVFPKKNKFGFQQDNG